MILGVRIEATLTTGSNVMNHPHPRRFPSGVFQTRLSLMDLNLGVSASIGVNK